MRRAVKRHIIGGPFERSSQHLHAGNEKTTKCESHLATDSVSTTDATLR